MSKTRQKLVHPKWFHSFFMQGSANSHNFHFRFLQAQVWSVNFTNFFILFLAGFCNLAKLRPPTKPGRGRTTACMTLWPLFYLLPLSCCWLRMASLLANLFQFAENEVPPVSLSLYFGHFHHICQRVLYHQNQQKGILESWHQGLVSTFSRIYWYIPATE